MCINYVILKFNLLLLIISHSKILSTFIMLLIKLSALIYDWLYFPVNKLARPTFRTQCPYQCKTIQASLYTQPVTLFSLCFSLLEPDKRTKTDRIWHSEDRASWYILIIKPKRCTNFSKFIFGIELYMFRTVSLLIIRCLGLYTQK
jgi:hypothetical protein